MDTSHRRLRSSLDDDEVSSQSPSNVPFSIDRVIKSILNLQESTVPKRKSHHHNRHHHRHVLWDDDTFSSHSMMSHPSPKNHGLSDDHVRSLCQRGLRLNFNICPPCALAGNLCKCIVSFDRSFASCEQSGVQMFQTSESEACFMEHRTSDQEPVLFSKTAMDTVVSRTGFVMLPCGYCGTTSNDTSTHEIVDVGQIVRALFYSNDLVTANSANSWVQNVINASKYKQRLPLLCCTHCTSTGIHLRSTCFAAYAILRRPSLRNNEKMRDEEVKNEFFKGKMTLNAYSDHVVTQSDRESKRMRIYLSRKQIARSIAEHHASSVSRVASSPFSSSLSFMTTAQQQQQQVNRHVDKDYDDSYDDQNEYEDNDCSSNIWEDDDCIFKRAEPVPPLSNNQDLLAKSPLSAQALPIPDDKFYLPTYLAQMKDGFKVFDREFHSSLLNSAFALRILVEKRVFTVEDALNVMISIFNNSRWRMEREAGIKVQLVTRIGTIPGSPLKTMFESNGSEAFQNQLGVLVEAFVEQHLHSILNPIVRGEKTSRSHLQWNEWLDQMSGFGIGNQSSDALMIAVFWQWKSDGFKVCRDNHTAVPELTRFDDHE